MYRLTKAIRSKNYKVSDVSDLSIYDMDSRKKVFRGDVGVA